MIFLVALFFLAWLIGSKWTPYGALGILVDHRGRCSLTHFQIVLWTIVILSSALGALFSSSFSPASVNFTPQLLGLMGISAGSAVFATAVKGAKDMAPEADIARAGTWVTGPGGAEVAVKTHFAQIWLEEEGEFAEKVVNITKFQNFVFTLIVLSVYIAIAISTGGLPVLPENIEWLIGVSHAGYVGGKMPGRK